MTKTEFMSACETACIDPNVALENDNIAEALEDKDDERVIFILATEF